jgi:hypothetical protein
MEIFDRRLPHKTSSCGISLWDRQSFCFYWSDKKWQARPGLCLAAGWVKQRAGANLTQPNEDLRMLWVSNDHAAGLAICH